MCVAPNNIRKDECGESVLVYRGDERESAHRDEYRDCAGQYDDVHPCSRVRQID